MPQRMSKHTSKPIPTICQGRLGKELLIRSHRTSSDQPTIHTAQLRMQTGMRRWALRLQLAAKIKPKAANYEFIVGRALGRALVLQAAPTHRPQTFASAHMSEPKSALEQTKAARIHWQTQTHRWTVTGPRGPALRSKFKRTSNRSNLRSR